MEDEQYVPCKSQNDTKKISTQPLQFSYENKTNDNERFDRNKPSTSKPYYGWIKLRNCGEESDENGAGTKSGSRQFFVERD